ncbi:MAPEG family protein [Massilia sp. GCM10023247]|uniref:MAPEG family protein n=1 Tax=Massilia sp. GCM10023247 TaxID=3252643 RepID=UPI0036144EA9
MVFTAWATLAVLGVYFWTGVVAGWARVKYKVPAPRMDGPPAFQSAQRVQANTLEQLPLVLGPLWLCAAYLGDGWAAAGGLLWCAARILYALGYYRDPARREAGFVLGMLACGALVAGSVVGLVLR